MKEQTLKEADVIEQHVSLKCLASRFAADRSSVRRWLEEAGIQAVAMGDGPRSAIRYRLSDVEVWLRSRPSV